MKIIRGNRKEPFGAVYKGFHWIIAVLVFGMIGLGLFMTQIDPPTPLMFQLYAWHKSIGVVILALIVLRVLWRYTTLRPPALPSHTQWEKNIAKYVHFLLYAALFIMPLSGWLMSSAKGFSVSVFGIFTLPDLIKPNDQTAKIMVEIHEVTAYTLIVLIGLHIVGALKHHFVDNDDTLRRILPFGRVSKE